MNSQSAHAVARVSWWTYQDCYGQEAPNDIYYDIGASANFAWYFSQIFLDNTYTTSLYHPDNAPSQELDGQFNLGSHYTS